MNESKSAFFYLRLFFLIKPFQWVTGESNRIFSPSLFHCLVASDRADRLIRKRARRADGVDPATRLLYHNFLILESNGSRICFSGLAWDPTRCPPPELSPSKRASACSNGRPLPRRHARVNANTELDATILRHPALRAGLDGAARRGAPCQGLEGGLISASVSLSINKPCFK